MVAAHLSPRRVKPVSRTGPVSLEGRSAWASPPGRSPRGRNGPVGKASCRGGPLFWNAGGGRRGDGRTGAAESDGIGASSSAAALLGKASWELPGTSASASSPLRSGPGPERMGCCKGALAKSLPWVDACGLEGVERGGAANGGLGRAGVGRVGAPLIDGTSSNLSFSRMRSIGAVLAPFKSVCSRGPSLLPPYREGYSLPACISHEQSGPWQPAFGSEVVDVS
jgi:hypothetical protein